MNVFEAQLLLQSKNYDFLRTNNKLNQNIMLLSLGGSHAYGTNTESSDVDIRGIAVNSPDELLGMEDSHWVFEDRHTDTVIYSFMKTISLLIKCNPNTIEMLGFDASDYLVLSPLGEELLYNKNLFLSQRCASSFGGYAAMQLRRLENALARDRVTPTRREEYIMRSVQATLDDFSLGENLSSENTIKLYVDRSDSKELKSEIMVDLSLHHYPLRRLKAMNSQFDHVVNQYSSLGKRNTKKDDQHLDKHAMHLVRLYLMCFDLLEKEQIITRRTKDQSFLMDIRKGCFRNPDGTYRDEFFELIESYEKRLDYAKKNTSLPPQPDIKRINEFVKEINRRVINTWT